MVRPSSRLASYLTLMGLVAACGTPSPTPGTGRDAASPDITTAEAADCPVEPQPASASPGVPPELRRAEAWIGADADRVLMTPEQIAEANARNGEVAGALRDVRSALVADDERIAAQLAERRAYLDGKVASGAYVEGQPGVMKTATSRMQAAAPVDELRAIVAESALWCVPSTDGLYTPARDLAFDRNRCSGLHPGEVVRALRSVTEGEHTWVYVHAGHSVGWLVDPVWTPPLEAAQVAQLLEPEQRLVIVTDGVKGDVGPEQRFGAALPLIAQDGDSLTALVPTTRGLAEARFGRGPGVHEGFVPLSRRALLEVAFSALDDPYGWGGWQAGRDCSRYVHDLLAVFGLQLGRNSGVQAQLGTRSVSLEGLSDAEKLARIDEASADGVVLLYMPGHIMLYLGRHEGRPYAISSLSEYLEPCDGGADTVFRLDRVEVTTLELGRGTERTAFIERLTRMVVFTGQP